MAIKQALIVDDSKSARVVLKRMLEGLDLVVNTTESADDAIHYLKSVQPDVIFMDHMMPGMDGFEAVKHLKNNSLTAAIPIMMYTSRGGDVYLSQARALGAVGIIPKTISPVGLKESLFKLGLIDDRRKSNDEDQVEVEVEVDDKSPVKELDSAEVEQKKLKDDLLEDKTKHDTSLEDLQRIMDDQTIELHKSMWLGIESVSHEIFNRLSTEIDDKFENLQTLPQDVANEMVKSKSTRVMFAVVSLLLCSIILNVVFLIKPNQHNDAVSVEDNLSAFFVEEEDISELQLNVDEVSSANNSAVSDFYKWADSKKIDYPYNELALNDARLTIIEELLDRALSSGYTGNIILQTHVGQFCLSTNENGSYVLADDDLAISQCQYVGNSMQLTDSPVTHQSLSFANYLSDLRSLNDKGIFLEVVTVSRVNNLEEYPVLSPETKVKQWNYAAQLNNRVTIKLKPAIF